MRSLLLAILLFVTFVPFEALAYSASIEKISNKQFAIKNRISEDLKCKVRLGHDTIFVVIPRKEISTPISITSLHSQKQLSLYCREVRKVTIAKSKVWRLNRYAASYSSVNLVY